MSCMGMIMAAQSIFLTIITITFPMLFKDYFLYIFALILGLLTFFYLKKHSKKDVLKINFWSSLVAVIIVIVVYVTLSHFFTGLEVSDVGEIGGLGSIVSIFNIANLLPNGLVFIVLFNLPMLIYYFFKGKDEEAIVNPNA